MSTASDHLREQVAANAEGDGEEDAAGQPAETKPGLTLKGGGGDAAAVRVTDVNLSQSTQPVLTAADDDDDNDNDEDKDDGDQSLPYPEPASTDQLLPPPDFKPFFTLIEDPATGEHYHPHVHYIFADDDADVLTPAALDTLDISNQASEDAEERIVIIDVAPDGRNVASATSLSPNWQGIKTTVRQAPSWASDAQEGDRGVMLKISGQEIAKGQGKRLHQAGSLEELVARFGEKLDVLDDVLRGKDGEEEQVDEQRVTTETAPGQ